jgi:hypothetical protein
MFFPATKLSVSLGATRRNIRLGIRNVTVEFRNSAKVLKSDISSGRLDYRNFTPL